MKSGSSERIAVLIGTRPEAIKLAPVIRQLTAQNGPPHVIASGQHRELLDPVLLELGIEPSHRLHAMQPGQSLAKLTAVLLAEIGSHLRSRDICWFVVQGDTASAAMGALAAFYSEIPVAHIEAGLRTQNPRSPFPEEVNRRLIADLAQLHFAPTSAARQNLLREGIADDRIHVVGNTIVDSLHHACDHQLPAATPDSPEQDRSARGKHLVFVTCHRRESLGDDLANICRGIRTLASQLGDLVRVVLPVHRNPGVRQIVERHLSDVRGVELTAPLSYLETVAALRKARIVITDSGGVLEEAATLGIPTLVVRRTCERTEALNAGVARLIAPEEDAIVQAATGLLTNDDEHRRMAVATDVFGDGHAAQRIVEILLQQSSSGD